MRCRHHAGFLRRCLVCSYSFRPLQREDASRCAELENALFPGDDPWSQAVFEQEICSPHTRYVAVDYAAEETAAALLVGYGGIGRLGPMEAPEYEIHTVGVAPDHQGRGLGRRIMEQLVAVADAQPGEIFLEVRTDNTPALRLYLSLGFRILGTRPHYYQPSGADAYTMCRAASHRLHADGERTSS